MKVDGLQNTMIDLPLMKCIRRFETTAAFAAVEKMHDLCQVLTPCGFCRRKCFFIAISHGAKDPEWTSNVFGFEKWLGTSCICDRIFWGGLNKHLSHAILKKQIQRHVWSLYCGRKGKEWLYITYTVYLIIWYVWPVFCYPLLRLESPLIRKKKWFP